MNKNNLFHNIKRVIYYFLIRQIRKIKNTITKNTKHKFLFILCPPYSGSTLLNQIISSSKSVSCNNELGVREGQLLPGVKHFMFTKDRWTQETKYDWQKIKNVWLQYWDHSKNILLDKSSPNIIHLNDIQKVFEESYFIIMVRNPYAQAEGIIRRNKTTADYAAQFVLKCLKYQKRNIDKKYRGIFFTYEELCDHPSSVLNKLTDFLPELSDINIHAKFKAHNFKTKNKMTVQNLNEEKINRLTKDQIEKINSYFGKEKHLLDFFNYEILN